MGRPWMTIYFSYYSEGKGPNLQPSTTWGYCQAFTRGLKYLIITILTDVNMGERLNYGRESTNN